MVAPHNTENPTYDLICVSVSLEPNRPRASHKITSTGPMIDDRLVNGTGILINPDPLSTGVPWGRTHCDQLETWGNDVNIIPSSGRRLRDRSFSRPRDGFRAQMVSDRGRSRPREEHASDSRGQMASDRGLLRPREENMNGFRSQMAYDPGLSWPREENVRGFRAQMASDRGLSRPREENMNGFRAPMAYDPGLSRPREENVRDFRAQLLSGRGRRATTRRMLSPYEIASQSRPNFPALAYLRSEDPWFSRLLGSSSQSSNDSLSDLAYMMRSRQLRFLN